MMTMRATRKMPLCLLLPLLLIGILLLHELPLSSSSSSSLLVSAELKVKWTPNDNDKGDGGPLPLSQKRREHLLQLDETIRNSPDPEATLARVAATFDEANPMSAQDLSALLERNRDDMQQQQDRSRSSKSSFLSFWNSLVVNNKWLLRIVFTLALAAAYHCYWMTSGNSITKYSEQHTERRLKSRLLLDDLELKEEEDEGMEDKVVEVLVRVLKKGEGDDDNDNDKGHQETELSTMMPNTKTLNEQNPTADVSKQQTEEEKKDTWLSNNNSDRKDKVGTWETYTERRRHDRLVKSRLLQDNPELEDGGGGEEEENVAVRVKKGEGDDKGEQPETTNKQETEVSVEDAPKIEPPSNEVTTTSVQKEKKQQQPHQQHENPWASSTDGRSSARTSPGSSPAHRTSDFLLTHSRHPGLQAFWHWWDVETSLFRVYCCGRTDGQLVAPPYNPSSRRGQVRVRLQVTNSCRSRHLTAYWVDYKGHEIDKGRFGPGETWHQTTYVDHPWCFRNSSNDDNDNQNDVVLHYVPYRVIPTTAQEPTADPDNPEIGLFRFSIRDISTSHDSNDDDNSSSPFQCQVGDSVMPFPARDFFRTVDICLSWTLLHCHRMLESSSIALTWRRVLVQYLSNIVQHPSEAKYRRIRVANPTFAPLWSSPVRGLLLAIGFVEHDGYTELGCSLEPLPRDRVQQVSQLIYQLEQWDENDEPQTQQQQPQGADGFGRAGFGRAGTMH